MADYSTPTGSGSASLGLDVSLLSQSQAGNYSVVRGTLQLRNVGSATFINSPVGCGIYLNGTWYDASYTWASGGGTRNIQVVDVTIYHDANGNASIPVAGKISATGTSGIGGPTQIPTGTFTLPRIPKPTSAPRSPAVTAGIGEATLSWVVPADNGGSAVTGYRVFYSVNANMSGATSIDVGNVTSRVVTGLTPGLRYYFTVAAINVAGLSPQSATVNALIGDVPAAPAAPTLVVTGNAVEVSYVAPADGGVPIADYTIEWATNAGFTAGLGSTVTTGLRATVPGLDPATGYYFRVKARNSVGFGPASPSSTVTTATRDVLDVVKVASLDVGKVQVVIRSDGANTPTLTLGYFAFGTGTAFTLIDTLPIGPAAGQFAVRGGARNIVLVADPAGALYVIGTDGANPNAVLVKRYAPSGSTWAPAGSLSQALPSTGDPLVQFAATYAPGIGATPVASIFLLVRRAGTIGTGSLSYATINPANVAASSGALFLAFGSNPSWLATPPSGAPHNSGLLDVAALVAGGTRLAILGDGFAVVDVSNGTVVGVSKAANGTVVGGSWARIVGVSAGAFATLTLVAGALTWTFYGANGAVLGSGSYAGANAFGGAFLDQWAAYVDRLAGALRVYYVADDSARKLESIDVSTVTYAATAPRVVTAALGAAASANGALRVPLGPAVDERRVVVEAANLLTGAKSTAAASDTVGNAAPTAPVTADIAGFDASFAQLFGWAFGDPNPLDAQSAYEVEVQRVSDSVNVIATGKVVSAAQAYTVAAAALANGVAYRWRARTWDELDTVGAWAAYDAFTTSALGTLTITDPAADNPPGLDVSVYKIIWAYAQGNGYVQTQRRVRMLVAATGAVLSDTGMQASTVGEYLLGGIPTDVPVIVEVSIITNAPGTPTITTTRRFTSSYASPMVPLVDLTLAESYVVVTVTNPAPTGARPEVDHNDIERRVTGSGSPFIRIAQVERNGTYNDHAVASRLEYDYRVKGVTA